MAGTLTSPVLTSKVGILELPLIGEAGVTSVISTFAVVAGTLPKVSVSFPLSERTLPAFPPVTPTTGAKPVSYTHLTLLTSDLV